MKLLKDEKNMKRFYYYKFSWVLCHKWYKSGSESYKIQIFSTVPSFKWEGEGGVKRWLWDQGFNQLTLT